MGRFSVDGHEEPVHAGIACAFRQGERSDRELRGNVKTKAACRAVYGAGFHHRLCAVAVLFIRLEKQDDASREPVPEGAERAGRSDEGRKMHVVAAGMHPAGTLAFIGGFVFFSDRERINIRAQRHAARSARPVKDGRTFPGPVHVRDDPRAGAAVMREP